MDDFLTAVLNVAMTYGVGFTMAPMSPSQGAVVDTFRRLIIMNSAWPNVKELAFQAAHELGHVLNGDVGHFAYSNVCTNNKVEGRANRTALSILVPIYFDEIDQEDANTEQFMADLAIPDWLRDASEDEIARFYQGAY